MIPLVRELIKQGTLVLAADKIPALGDVTAAKLKIFFFMQV